MIKPVLRYAAVAAIALSLMLVPTPASATPWGGACADHKYILNKDADVLSCDKTGETFFTCYYSCQCITC